MLRLHSFQIEGRLLSIINTGRCLKASKTNCSLHIVKCLMSLGVPEINQILAVTEIVNS
jgi:hypothetical protein